MSLREASRRLRTAPRDMIRRHRAQRPKIDWTEYAPVAGQLADALSTHYSLSKGAVEANPVMKPLTKSMPLFYGLKILAGVGMGAMVHAQEKAGHFRRAKVLSIIGTALGVGPAIHNLRVARRVGGAP